MLESPKFNYLADHQKPVGNAMYEKRKKSTFLAYLLFILFLSIGGHRIYLGHYGTAMKIAAVNFCTLGLGLFITVFDVINLDRLIVEENELIVDEIIKELTLK